MICLTNAHKNHLFDLVMKKMQRQVFKHVKILPEQSKKKKEQKKNKGSVHVAESAYISQKAQFGLVMLANS